jgi:hypothetical protein
MELWKAGWNPCPPAPVARHVADDRGGMFWASRTFAPDGWYEAQDRFEEQWADAGEPADMMLVYAETPDFQTRLFVGLPAMS